METQQPTTTEIKLARLRAAMDALRLECGLEPVRNPPVIDVEPDRACGVTSHPEAGTVTP